MLLPIIGLFAITQYQPIKIQELKNLAIKKVEIYSEVTTHLWLHQDGEDSVITGVEVYHYEFDPGLLKNKIEEHFIKEPVCGYGCMLDAGLMVINDKYLIDVPCGFQDDGEITLLLFPKEKKCVEYIVKTNAKPFVKWKEKLIPTKRIMPAYREMLKVNLKTN
jgi:hypothetical protein